MEVISDVHNHIQVKFFLMLTQHLVVMPIVFHSKPKGVFIFYKLYRISYKALGVYYTHINQSIGTTL